MKWIKTESKILDHYEYLCDVRGRFIGYVCMFRDSCAYAWTEHRKIGSYKTVNAAKKAVEALVKR